jgi:hypothetical protein
VDSKEKIIWLAIWFLPFMFSHAYNYTLNIYFVIIKIFFIIYKDMLLLILHIKIYLTIILIKYMFF